MGRKAVALLAAVVSSGWQIAQAQESSVYLDERELRKQDNHLFVVVGPTFGASAPAGDADVYPDPQAEPRQTTYATSTDGGIPSFGLDLAARYRPARWFSFGLFGAFDYAFGSAEIVRTNETPPAGTSDCYDRDGLPCLFEHATKGSLRHLDLSGGLDVRFVYNPLVGWWVEERTRNYEVQRRVVSTVYSATGLTCTFRGGRFGSRIFADFGSHDLSAYYAGWRTGWQFSSSVGFTLPRGFGVDFFLPRVRFYDDAAAKSGRFGWGETFVGLAITYDLLSVQL